MTTLSGATGLLRRAKDAGLAVAIATSASARDAALLRKALDVEDVVDEVVTNDDAGESKPAPDIRLSAALDALQLAATQTVFVGDTVWDVQAAPALKTRSPKASDLGS